MSGLIQGGGNKEFEDSEINKSDVLWAECVRDAKGDMRKAQQLYTVRRCNHGGKED